MENIIKNMGKALSFILITLIITQNSAAEAWRGIVPLRSTRADVERLLGSPQQGSRSVYQTEGERISITYAERPCDYGWQVLLDTVISFSVYPKNPPTLAELQLDERKYEKRRDIHIETLYYYINQAEGINYTVDTGKGVVTSVERYPSAKDNNRRCSPVAASPVVMKDTSKVVGRVLEKRGKRRKNSGKP